MLIARHHFEGQEISLNLAYSLDKSQAEVIKTFSTAESINRVQMQSLHILIVQKSLTLVG